MCVFERCELACLPDTQTDRHIDTKTDTVKIVVFTREMLISGYRDIKEHAVFTLDRENSIISDNYTMQFSTSVTSTTLDYHPGRTMKCTVLI